ncbi:MAG TPA: helix-turn-helix domain-containing protein [Candidatus Acidoferrales bacterium]|nr:helix-turn-helix domain-containing protein [Candidatus Acidoferrales bacterium]
MGNDGFLLKQHGGAYVSLGEASRQLGITPGTLRRWADKGQIPSFITPGGHRRFSQSTIAALSPRPRPRRPALSELGSGGDHISRAYRRLHPPPGGTPIVWVSTLSDQDRAAFRERGRKMSEALITHLDAKGRARARLALLDAERQGREYGGHSAALGVSLSEAIEGFLRFRSPFIESLATTARQRGLDTKEATGLLVDAGAAMDKVLLAFIQGWRTS